MNRKLMSCIDDYNINEFKRLTVDIEKSELNHILCYLVRENHYPMVEALCAEGYDFSIINGRCLLMAIKYGFTEMIDILLRCGNCDANLRYGLPLRTAVNVFNLEAIKILTSYNLNYNIDRGRAFLEAALRDSLNIVEFLLEKHPPYAKVQDSAGAHYAILNKNEAMLLLFLKNGASLSERHLAAAKHVDNIRLIKIVEANKTEQEI